MSDQRTPGKPKRRVLTANDIEDAGLACLLAVEWELSVISSLKPGATADDRKAIRVSRQNIRKFRRLFEKVHHV